MKDCQKLESALFGILEEKSSDFIKSTKLISFFKSIRMIKDTYEQQLNYLRSKDILIEEVDTSFISMNVLRFNLTPLMIAVSHNDVNCAKLLIKENADIEFGNDRNLTPLMLAAKNGHEACVDLLIKAKAQLDIKTSTHFEDRSALMLAAEHGNTGCLKLLMEAKANLHLQDSYFNDDAFFLAVKKGDLESVKLLIEKVDINRENNSKKHVLKIALDREYNTLLNFLANSTKINLKEKSLLSFFAIDDDNVSALKILLDAKADMNAEYDGHSLLTYAVRLNKKNIISFLYQAGFDMNAKNKNGDTALTTAIIYDHDHHMIKFLCKLGAIVTGVELDRLLKFVGSRYKIPSIVALLEHGSVINNPIGFLNFIESPGIDFQSDLDVFYCYEILHEQLKKLPVIDILGKKYFVQPNGSNLDASDDEFIIEKIFPKIQEAVPYWQLETTHQLLPCSAFKKVPREVINIISLFDHSVGRNALTQQNTDKCFPRYMQNLKGRVQADPIAKKHIGFFQFYKSRKRKCMHDDVAIKKTM